MILSVAVAEATQAVLGFDGLVAIPVTRRVYVRAVLEAIGHPSAKVEQFVARVSDHHRVDAEFQWTAEVGSEEHTEFRRQFARTVIDVAARLTHENQQEAPPMAAAETPDAAARRWEAEDETLRARDALTEADIAQLAVEARHRRLRTQLADKLDFYHGADGQVMIDSHVKRLERAEELLAWFHEQTADPTAPVEPEQETDIAGNPIIRSGPDGGYVTELGEFDVTVITHDPGCPECWMQAQHAVTMAKVTGSRGATSSIEGDGTITHAATVVRVRCGGRADCCCGVHIAIRAGMVDLTMDVTLTLTVDTYNKRIVKATVLTPNAATGELSHDCELHWPEGEGLPTAEFIAMRDRAALIVEGLQWPDAGYES